MHHYTNTADSAVSGILAADWHCRVAFVGQGATVSLGRQWWHARQTPSACEE